METRRVFALLLLKILSLSHRWCMRYKRIKWKRSFKFRFFPHMIQRWYMLLSPASCTSLLTFEMYLISISASEVRCEHCFLRRATYIFIPMKSPINYVSYAAFLIILFKSVFHILYFETFVVVIEFDSATMERCYVVTCILICTFADTFLCLLYFYKKKYSKLK